MKLFKKIIGYLFIGLFPLISFTIGFYVLFLIKMILFWEVPNLIYFPFVCEEFSGADRLLLLVGIGLILITIE